MQSVQVRPAEARTSALPFHENVRRLPDALRTEQGRVVLQAVGVWAATRLAFVVLTYFGLLFGRVLSDPAHGGDVMSGTQLLQSWYHWDTTWFINNAMNGYAGPDQTAFFPLYPLIIRGVTILLGGADPLVAALVVANLGTLAAFIALALLAHHELGAWAASPAIRILCAYPLAFFLAAGYSEGLFLALATISLLCARKGHWLGAAACAFLAGLTRPTAAALILPLAWEFLRQHEVTFRRWRTWRPLLRPRQLATGLALVGAVPIAVSLYLIFLWRTFGDPLIFLQVEHAQWGRQTMPFWTALYHGFGRLLKSPVGTFNYARLLVDFVPALALGGLLIAFARRVPFVYTLYVSATVLLSIASLRPDMFDLFASSGRSMLMCAPILVFLGPWIAKRPSLDAFLMSAGLMLEGVLTIFFLQGGPLV